VRIRWHDADIIMLGGVTSRVTRGWIGGAGAGHSRARDGSIHSFSTSWEAGSGVMGRDPSSNALSRQLQRLKFSATGIDSHPDCREANSDGGVRERWWDASRSPIETGGTRLLNRWERRYYVVAWHFGGAVCSIVGEYRAELYASVSVCGASRADVLVKK